MEHAGFLSLLLPSILPMFMILSQLKEREGPELMDLNIGEIFLSLFKVCHPSYCESQT